MPSTPPPTSLRARTPPTPLHGPQYDNYEPYSPRRSTRSTAQSNPYSFLNAERSPQGPRNQQNITPPASAKRIRFAHQTTHLSSPPSSPSSPIRHRSQRKFLRKDLPSFTRKSVNGALSSDSDHASSSLARANIDPTTMLPTPSKTPKKRQVAAMNSAARILSFQPNDPNDVMPTPRKAKRAARHHPTSGFDLYDEEIRPGGDGIEIYTDPNARVPQMDEAEDNPFIGKRRAALRPQRKSRKAPTAEDVAMDEAAARDEGVVYVFRGKKILRRFTEADDEHDSLPDSELGERISQRSLQRKAGASAQRPLTRSAIKPRLLFPSEEQLVARAGALDNVDEEEAVTDIEMPNATSPAKSDITGHLDTPRAVAKHNAATPPPSTRAKRSPTKKAAPLESTPTAREDLPEAMSLGSAEDTSPRTRAGRVGVKHSPFDSWQRTKAGRKRAGDPSEQATGSGKRTRSAAVESSA